MMCVYRFCTTELDEGITALYGEKGIGRVVYLTHAEIGSIHRACKHASMSFKANQNVELYVVLMPRHMQVCVCFFLPGIYIDASLRLLLLNCDSSNFLFLPRMCIL